MQSEHVKVKILLQEKKYEEAFSILEPLFPQNSSDPELYFMLGEYFMAVEDISNAVRSFKKASQLNWNDPEYYLALATAYEAFNEPASAMEAYLKVIALDERSELAMQRLTNLTRHTYIMEG